MSPSIPFVQVTHPPLPHFSGCMEMGPQVTSRCLRCLSSMGWTTPGLRLSLLTREELKLLSQSSAQQLYLRWLQSEATCSWPIARQCNNHGLDYFSSIHLQGDEPLHCWPDVTQQWGCAKPSLKVSKFLCQGWKQQLGPFICQLWFMSSVNCWHPIPK